MCCLLFVVVYLPVHRCVHPPDVYGHGAGSHGESLCITGQEGGAVQGGPGRRGLCLPQDARWCPRPRHIHQNSTAGNLQSTTCHVQYVHMCQGFIQRVGGPWNPPPPENFKNLYSLVLMHDAVAVPHKLLPPPKNPV